MDTSLLFKNIKWQQILNEARSAEFNICWSLIFLNDQRGNICDPESEKVHPFFRTVFSSVLCAFFERFLFLSVRFHTVFLPFSCRFSDVFCRFYNVFLAFFRTKGKNGKRLKRWKTSVLTVKKRKEAFFIKTFFWCF